MGRRIFSKTRLFSSTAWQVRFALWGGAVLLGLVATFFADAAEKANGLFAGVVAGHPYAALVISPLGLMLASWLTVRFFPGAQGSGIPQTLAALDRRTRGGLRESMLSIRIAVGKIALALLGLASGAAIGREGPTVHIGAAIMYSLGRIVKYPPHYMQRALILGGGAAGIAAAFNTPLAGIVFAIEEMSRSFEEQASGVVLTAVIFAGMTALVILGNYSYFGHTTVAFTYASDWLAIPICAVAGGLAGGVFSQVLISGSRRLAPTMRRHPVWIAGACGLVVALVGLASGNLSYGTGYAEAERIITHGAQVDPWYSLYKGVATVASYLSGIPGGIFAPSLATGAGLGSNLAAWFPAISSTAVIMLGMAAYFTGVVQAPITAFVIIMEMTDNHEMLLPLMATAFIADGVSRLVCPTPIYRALAEAFLAPAAPQPLTGDFKPDLEEEQHAGESETGLENSSPENGSELESNRSGLQND